MLVKATKAMTDLLRCFDRSDKSIDSFINAVAGVVAI